MKIVTANDNFVVIDDFLDEDTLKSLRDFVATREFEFKNANLWDKVWRLSDGRPLIESTIKMYRLPFTYNPASPYDNFASRLLALVTNEKMPLTDDWTSFSCAANIYPAGTALSWHDDGKEKIGAYSYYIHPEWNVRWGGELLVADHRPIYSLESEVNENSQCLENSVENQFLMEFGMGTYIHPKPNRLVILSSRTLHSIRAVDTNAGDNARLSIQGFFVSNG